MLVSQIGATYEFCKKHPHAQQPLRRWKGLMETAQFDDILDLRRVIPTADAIKGTNLTCFNIGGNKYRLIVYISYPLQEAIVREMLTHEQYTRKYVR